MKGFELVDNIAVHYKCKNVNFLVTSERGGMLGLELFAKKHEENVIGGFQDQFGTGVVLINSEGETKDKRYKAVYPGFREAGRKEGKIRVFNCDGVSILPIICYEIVFPKLFMETSFKPDFVTHHIGFPMFDVFQLEGWKALQEVMSKFFNCDVVVSCGGDLKTPMNLTGIVKPDGKPYNYNHLYNNYSGGHTL